MAKITIDKEKCIGCGACEAIAPRFYTMKAGKAIVKKQPSSKEEETQAKDAAQSCPVGAIVLK